MARKRRRSNQQERVLEEGAEVVGSEWCTSSPRRPATHVIRVDHDERLLIWNTCAAWAAKKAVDIIIGEETFRWLDHKTIITENGIKIKSDQLEELMELEMPKRVEEWDFPENEKMHFLRIRKTRAQIKQDHEEQEPRRADTASPPTPRVKRTASVPRASRDGLVTIQAICEEIGVDPKDARGVLRKSKDFQKGPAGWAWSEGEADKVRKFLNAQEWK